MGLMRSAALLFLWSLIPLSIAAQQAPQRDPQAVAVLTQSVNAAGGPAAARAVQDFKGTGTITYHWAGEDISGSVNVYGKGLNQFRMDANVSGGTHSFIVNGDAGALIPLNGQRISLPSHSVMTAGSLTFPAGRIATGL